MSGYELPSLDALFNLAEEWERREDNSPYGFDESNNRIPALDGKQCAEMLRTLLKEAATRNADDLGEFGPGDIATAELCFLLVNSCGHKNYRKGSVPVPWRAECRECSR